MDSKIIGTITFVSFQNNLNQGSLTLKFIHCFISVNKPKGKTLQVEFSVIRDA